MLGVGVGRNPILTPLSQSHGGRQVLERKGSILNGIFFSISPLPKQGRKHYGKANEKRKKPFLRKDGSSLRSPPPHQLPPSSESFKLPSLQNKNSLESKLSSSRWIDPMRHYANLMKHCCLCLYSLVLAV